MIDKGVCLILALELLDKPLQDIAVVLKIVYDKYVHCNVCLLLFLVLWF